MKKYFFIMLCVIWVLPVAARHVAGGELFYEYLGPGAAAGSSNYRITLRLFRDCASTGPLLENEQVNVGIYENGTLVNTLNLPLFGSVDRLNLNTKAIPCLVGDPLVCYQVAIYTNVITLFDSQIGYTLARQGCCRIDNISNLANRSNVGSNYVTQMPGTNILKGGHNSSPQFRVKDTALVCSDKKFLLDFGASDIDKDSLTFAFCDGYSAPNGSNNSPVPVTMNLVPLNYLSPYNGSSPLGPGVIIDRKTGIISGIAPGAGQYVVSVCITEWRSGVPINEHRKDFILKVDACDLIEADLPDKIVKCDTNVVAFENGSASSSITSYLWEFGVPGSPNNFSNNPKPVFTYADTGRYIARLTVTGPGGCVGTDSTEVLVYPGFKPAMTVNGSCFQTPYQFNDATFARYGTVNSWRWNFGDPTTDKDSSLLQNNSYKYANGGFTTDITLVVGSSKGCLDSVRQTITVRDKPLINLPFRDTVICSNDSLLIPASGIGSFNWTPNNNTILFANTARPVVFPKDTARYVVRLTDNGCVNTDTVTVNVVQYITVQLGPDTTICLTDPVTLRPQTLASSFRWSPAATLNNASVRNPVATPLVNTLYTVVGNLGSCQASDQILVSVVPYPKVDILTRDTAICYGNRVPLTGTYTGTGYRWSPTASLLNIGSLNPIAGPTRNTLYYLTVVDTTQGACPKPVTDSVLVRVVPFITVFAGRDTTIVPDQLLQLNATASNGQVAYRWSPSTGMDNPAIANPVIQLGEDIDSILYRVRATDPSGCYGEDDILVKMYKNGPDILVPSAFTPNADGKNDVLRPLTFGISQLRYFRIFNKWGQLLFETTQLGKGWDGTYNGVKQASGTYVFMTEGADFTGKTLFRKGTSVLIR